MRVLIIWSTSVNGVEGASIIVAKVDKLKNGMRPAGPLPPASICASRSRFACSCFACSCFACSCFACSCSPPTNSSASDCPFMMYKSFNSSFQFFCKFTLFSTPIFDFASFLESFLNLLYMLCHRSSIRSNIVFLRMPLRFVSVFIACLKSLYRVLSISLP